MIIVGIALLVLFGAVCVAIIKQSAFEQDRKQARQFHQLNQPDRSYWT